jgi:uncharacterized membrane-anchored protein YitT (DUF2179 family)
MNVIFTIFTIIILGICINNYLQTKRIEDILDSIQDKETQRNIVYQKMLDEYVKMLSAMDLNSHCYNSINEEYVVMNNTFKKLIERIDKVKEQCTSLFKKIDEISNEKSA